MMMSFIEKVIYDQGLGVGASYQKLAKEMPSVWLCLERKELTCSRLCLEKKELTCARHSTKTRQLEETRLRQRAGDMIT